jgi:hypothetical protein
MVCPRLQRFRSYGAITPVKRPIHSRFPFLLSCLCERFALQLYWVSLFSLPDLSACIRVHPRFVIRRIPRERLLELPCNKLPFQIQ